MIKVHLVIKLHKQVIRKNVERLGKRGYEIGLWKLHIGGRCIGQGHEEGRWRGRDGGVGEEEGRPKGGMWRWILDRSGSVKHIVQHFLPDHSFSYVWKTYMEQTHGYGGNLWWTEAIGLIKS